MTPGASPRPTADGQAPTHEVARSVRLIAFYLPQFHPIPENDAWWGRGFTEWRNVARATPLFPGHRQPRVPADLGYYDLRVPEVRRHQATLASAHGIHGFCYYYYWFSGRRLLERPLDEVLASQEPDFPFCICWANENWTRRWDGDAHEILIAQDHSEESDARFILDAIPILRDRRYIRFDDKPVLLVYRANILPEAVRTTEIWRETCRAHGIPDIHLVAAQTFGLEDPRPFGFDAAVEFPPHGIRGSRIHRVAGLHPEFQGKIHDYREAVEFGIGRPREPYPLHRAVMASWDNTARRGLHAHVWHNGSPDQYERWLRAVVEASSRDPRDPDPLVFINAWNEWAEGAYLEPDESSGYSYLRATRRALLAGSPGPQRSSSPSETGALSTEELRKRVRDLEGQLGRLERANAYFRAELEARDAMEDPRVTSFSPEPPAGLPPGLLPLAGRMQVEHIGPVDHSGSLLASGGRRFRIRGWTSAEGIDPGGIEEEAALILRSHTRDLTYFAPLGERIRRPDLSQPIDGSEAPPTAGFSVTAWYDGVEPGLYEIGIVQMNRSRAVVTLSKCRIEVPNE